MKQMFRHGDLGVFAIKPDGVIIEFFDGIRVPDPGRHDRIAYVIKAIRRDLFEHIALHQSEDGRAHVGIKPASHIPYRMVGDERLTGAPSHVWAKAERPGLQVVTCLPSFEQPGAGNVVGTGTGQVIVDLPDEIGVVNPGEGVGMAAFGHPHRDAHRATAHRRAGLGPGFRRDAGHAIRGASGETQKRRKPQEFAPAQTTCGQLVNELGDRRVEIVFTPPIGHGASRSSHNDGVSRVAQTRRQRFSKPRTGRPPPCRRQCTW